MAAQKTLSGNGVNVESTEQLKARKYMENTKSKASLITSLIIFLLSTSKLWKAFSSFRCI